MAREHTLLFKKKEACIGYWLALLGIIHTTSMWVVALKYSYTNIYLFILANHSTTKCKCTVDLVKLMRETC